MTDIRAMLQRVLDAEFLGNPRVFWQRRAESSGGKNPSEYIVYTLMGNYNRVFADNEVLIDEAECTVRYYYRYGLADTKTGRDNIKDREARILSALKIAGFSCPSGAFDVGDVDEVGCFTTVIPCNYGRVI